MATVLAVVFAITTAYCAFWWLVTYISMLSALFYALDKGVPQPTDDEIKVYTSRVIRALFRRKRGKR